MRARAYCAHYEPDDGLCAALFQHVVRKLLGVHLIHAVLYSLPECIHFLLPHRSKLRQGIAGKLDLLRTR